MRSLFFRRKKVKIIGLHAQQSLGMFSNDVDVAAPSEVSEIGAESVGTDCFYDFFAVHALVQSHFFFVGWSFTVLAGLVRLFSINIKGPET